MPDHPHCHSTALVFSLYTRRDIDSDDSYARPLVRVCATAHRLVSSVNETARRTQQKHGKQTLLLCFCFGCCFFALTLLVLLCSTVLASYAVLMLLLQTAFATASAAASAA